jgi:hypothetical protein
MGRLYAGCSGIATNFEYSGQVVGKQLCAVSDFTLASTMVNHFK